MILVTVGMTPHPFDRLVRATEQMAALTEEPVVIQKGSSKVTEHFAKHIDFANPAEMENLLSSARVVVTHAAAGSVLTAMAFQKPLVVVPRLAQYGEHLDDHQWELAEALAEAGSVVIAEKVSGEGLLRAVEQARQPEPSEGKTRRLVDFMPSLLADIERKRITSRWRRWWSKGRLEETRSRRQD